MHVHLSSRAARIATWRLVTVLLSAITVAGPYRAEAQDNVWRTNGPEGGTILALTVDPQTPTTLYAGTRYDGIFKSTDAGTTWSPVNTSLSSTCVAALAIDPLMPATLYAGLSCSLWDASGGILKTIDGGATWIDVNNGLSGAPPVFSLAIDPQTPTTLYAATSTAGSPKERL